MTGCSAQDRISTSIIHVTIPVSYAVNTRGMSEHVSELINPERFRSKRGLETEEDLVAAATGGSDHAFTMLAERYYDAIFGYLIRQTGDRELAEDLAQETMVIAYRKIRTLEDGRRFAGWLFRIAQNELRSNRRRAKIRQFLSIDKLKEEFGFAPKTTDRSSDPHIATERDQIQQVLDELSPNLRDALLLARLWGFPSKEVARILGISPSAARQRISRADDQFRTLYQQLDGANQ
jgi:RNA polymerase sigma-70 factor, ECF subfamily